MADIWIEELFGPVGRVALRRMFGGQGIYLDGRMIAIEVDGLIWLKGDAETEPALRAAGSRRFTYARAGKEATMGFWLLPEEALDDPERFRDFAGLAIAAAGRGAAKGKGTTRNKITNL
jgi:DNA transformation protein and related proteins